MWWSLLLEFLCIAIFVAVILWWLRSPGFVSVHVILNVWLSWTMALSFVALVPLDLNLVYVQRCLDVFGGNSTLAGERCPMEYWRSWSAVESITSDEMALDRSKEALRVAWLVVYTVCIANGWFILTAQQGYEENRNFSTYRRFIEAVSNNACFWVTVATLFSVLVMLLAFMGQDQEYVVFGLMALGNTICLLVVSLLLGYGLVEFPRSLFQSGRIKYSIRKAQGQAIDNFSAFQDAAQDMARLMCKVYALRRAASSSLRRLGNKIMMTVKECPFDIANTVMMDPVKGPQIPITEEQMHKAFLSQLSEIRNESTHKQKTTEVDRWLTALEIEQNILPKNADMFGIQEALFNTGFRMIGDVDHLDPGVRGGYDGEEGLQERRRVIARQLELMSVPGEWEVHYAFADAVIKRNDSTNETYEPQEGWGIDEMMGMLDPVERGGKVLVGGIEADKWDDPKLVKLRAGLYKACRKYRKAKAKFDSACHQAILMEDLKSCHDKLMPWKNVKDTLLAAWNTKEGEESPWKGLQSPVRKPFKGKYAMKLEVAYFVCMFYLRSFLCVVGAIGSAVLSVMILISESSMSPLLGGGKYSTSDRGSLLLDMICERASVPPVCIEELVESLAEDPDKTLVYSDVQWVIILHIFYMCTLCYWALLRVRLLGLYEVVPGETDAFSLLFNAFAVCRLAPSIVQNYLGMVHESHEERDPSERSVDLTVFEQTFSAMGRIPFIGWSFNEVLPPIMMIIAVLTAVSASARSCGCQLPRFDAEEHKTEDRIEKAKEVIALERRKYQTMRSQSSTIQTRMELFPELYPQSKPDSLTNNATIVQAVAVSNAAKKLGEQAVGGVKDLGDSLKKKVGNAKEFALDKYHNTVGAASREGSVDGDASSRRMLDDQDDLDFEQGGGDGVSVTVTRVTKKVTVLEMKEVTVTTISSPESAAGVYEHGERGRRGRDNGASDRGASSSGTEMRSFGGGARRGRRESDEFEDTAEGIEAAELNHRSAGGGTALPQPPQVVPASLFDELDDCPEEDPLPPPPREAPPAGMRV